MKEKNPNIYLEYSLVLKMEYILYSGLFYIQGPL